MNNNDLTKAIEAGIRAHCTGWETESCEYPKCLNRGIGYCASSSAKFLAKAVIVAFLESLPANIEGVIIDPCHPGDGNPVYGWKPHELAEMIEKKISD